jgi:YHS domain-containing protein
VLQQHRRPATSRHHSQHNHNEDRIVELTRDRNEVGYEVDRHREVSDQRGDRCLPPTRHPDDVFGSIELDYKAALNVLATVVFVVLIGLTVRRGSTDPVCGMKVDKAKANRKDFAGETYYFCSEHCLHAFELEPDRYTRESSPSDEHAAHAH